VKIRTIAGEKQLIDDAGNVVAGAVIHETTAERNIGASALVRLPIEDIEVDGVPFFGARVRAEMRAALTEQTPPTL
jgi:hypothetical protein